MNDIVTVLDLIKQMAVCVPSIIAGTMLITGMINGAFNIQNNNVKHWISWIVAVLGAICTLYRDFYFFDQSVRLIIASCFLNGW